GRSLHHPGDSTMATTATAAPGKTSFVKEFLQGNPQANAKAVNEAWTAAGMKGTISHPVISVVRKQLGLTGNPPGKTSCVKDFLNANPQGKTKDVNEAWTAAGMKGTISHPIISQVRKQLGLTGNLPGKTRNAAKEKAASNMPRTATPTPGKTIFVKDFLNANPQGNTKAVNEAWRAAGFEGTISPT